MLKDCRTHRYRGSTCFSHDARKIVARIHTLQPFSSDGPLQVGRELFFLGGKRNGSARGVEQDRRPLAATNSAVVAVHLGLCTSKQSSWGRSFNEAHALSRLILVLWATEHTEPSGLTGTLGSSERALRCRFGVAIQAPQTIKPEGSHARSTIE